MSLTYLDWHATAPMRPEAIDAVERRMRAGGNASAVHRLGREARLVVEDARAAVARLVGADPANVIFTGGGTEADNLALRGVAGRRLMVSAIEHGAVLAPAMLHDAHAVLAPVGSLLTHESVLIQPSAYYARVGASTMSGFSHESSRSFSSGSQPGSK